MNTELFVARRMAAQHGGDSRNVMVRIAVLTVAIGVAAMIVSLAVISGFKHELTAKLVGFGSHMTVTDAMGNNSLESSPIAADTAFERAVQGIDGFASIHSYAVKGGVFKTAEAIQGVMLKGVDSRFDWSFFNDRLVAGQLPRVGDSVRHKDILIARSLAGMMKTEVDDRVEILFISGDSPPRRDRFRVVGIYDSGMAEMDKMVVLTDLSNVQRLNGWTKDQIGGYGIACRDIRKIGRFGDEVRGVAEREWPSGNILLAEDLYAQYPSMFDWLKTHDVNGAVVIVVMTIVALLNIISAILIILLERTSTIGVLKTLGMPNRSLQKAFVIRSSFIVLRGMLWGNIAGIALCMAQKLTGAVKLDEAGYFLSEVPIHFDWWHIAALDAGVFAVTVAVLTLPTLIIASVSPEKTIRYS